MRFIEREGFRIEAWGFVEALAGSNCHGFRIEAEGFVEGPSASC